MAARGIPVRLSHIDNAKIYRSPQLASIAVSIGTLTMHLQPYQPEGRGKIERCFRTVRDQFLVNLDPKGRRTLDGAQRSASMRTAGDPPQIKVAPSRDESQGTCTLAELMDTLHSVTYGQS